MIRPLAFAVLILLAGLTAAQACGQNPAVATLPLPTPEQETVLISVPQPGS